MVLAAGALRTPLILLRSAVTHHAIGRNLFLHPTVAVAGRYDHDVLMWRDTMQAARSLQLVRDDVLIESAPPHPGLIALAFPWQGSAGLDELMKDIRHYAPFIGIVRDREPGRVKLSGSGRARIEYRVSKADAITGRKALVAMAQIGRASGAKRLVALGTPAVWHDVTPDERGFGAYLDQLRRFDFSPNRASVFSAHQMGNDPGRGQPNRSRLRSMGASAHRKRDKLGRQDQWALRRRRVPIPNRSRREPDGHRHDARRSSRSDGPRGLNDLGATGR